MLARSRQGNGEPGNRVARRLAAGALLAALAAIAPAIAEETPTPGELDPRIRFVDFAADDVVRIVGHFGFLTDITLAPDETVTSLVLGDTLAWEVAPATNHVFVKPREVEARTNMTVLTNKGRTYTFTLATAPKGAGKPKTEDLYFRVVFQYPKEQAALAAAADTSTAAAAQLAEAQREIRNIEYFACGDATVTPNQAFDDGRFTYMRYVGNRPLPAIFVVNPDGTEALVDSHVEEDTVVVHRVAQRFVFRHGAAVGCMVNKGFDPRGRDTFNGTVDPAVERVMAEGVTG